MIQKELLKKANVHSVGRGFKIVNGEITNQVSWRCSVEKKIASEKLSDEDMIPKHFAGLPTDVIKRKPMTALALEDPTGRFRPAPGGVSIGHHAITAGTLGCYAKHDGKLYILSNNHVMANSNNGVIGDNILQPGPHDGGTVEKDTIANLTDFVPINLIGITLPECPTAKKFVNIVNLALKILGRSTRIATLSTQDEDPTENLVDAAIALPVLEQDIDETIQDIGKITGMQRPGLGTQVQKYGRTTLYTIGEIIEVDVTANVGYGTGTMALFVDQFMCGPISAGGDSGSAILDMENNIVGLLFAGSDEVTLCNNIDNVFDMLKLSL